MLREAYVGDIAYVLGDRTLSVEEAVAGGATLSAAADFRRGGFARHHRCSAGLDAYALARGAVEQLRGRLEDIDVIVYATALPRNACIEENDAFARTRDVKHLMRFAASELQAEFGLAGAAVFGLDQQACTGALGALRLARSLVAAEPDVRRVLCVTADRFPEGALYEQAYNLVSDGAAACVVSAARAPFRILACHALTNGALSRASDDQAVGTFFSHALATMRGALAKAGLEIAQIDWIVPQNTHAAAWQILAGLLPFDPARVHFPALAEAGHVIASDNLINLKALEASGRLRAGDKVMLFMAGYGLNWQCTLLERSAGD